MVHKPFDKCLQDIQCAGTNGRTALALVNIGSRVAAAHFRVEMRDLLVGQEDTFPRLETKQT